MGITIKEYAKAKGCKIAAVNNLIELGYLQAEFGIVESGSLSIPRYLNIAKYSEIMAIDTSTVHMRSSRGRIKLINKNGILLVDTKSYKPGRVGRPKKIK